MLKELDFQKACISACARATGKSPTSVSKVLEMYASSPDFNLVFESNPILEAILAFESGVSFGKRFAPQPSATQYTALSVFKDLPDAPDMVVIPSGNFMMGSDHNPHERPIHPVSIKAFAIGKTPVTQAQWIAVMGKNPSNFKSAETANHPVENISWNDTQEYIQKLNSLTGQTYRLPSDSEWEYACRSGSTGKWCFGDDAALLPDYAWFYLNSDDSTRAVGQKKPNAFGLYDMHGNVWEFCQDVWSDTYEDAPSDGSANKKRDTGRRVSRGGSWNYFANYARSAFRDGDYTTYRSNNLGFRLARMLP